MKIRIYLKVLYQMILYFPRTLVVLNLFLKAVHIKAYCLDLLDLALFKAWQCILCWCYALERSLNKSKLLAQEKVK